MSSRLPAMQSPGGQRHDGPVYRSIVAVDIEGSTTRTNPVKGALRHTMYGLLGRAMDALAISPSQREPLADRGDGALLLIRPDDDMPKTVLLGQLIPLLTALVAEHNETAADPAVRMRLRAVVHAGEVHCDAQGFYGEAIDVAIRLLDSPAVKSALRQAESPLALVVSEEIYFGIVAHGYLDTADYRQLVRVRMADKSRRGWVTIPKVASELTPERLAGSSRRLLRSA
jgi:hypothetical protein